MFNSLLYMGLCATAFAFFPGCDLREVKMTAAIGFALALCMAEIFSKGLKPGKNIWVYLLLAYIPISMFCSPAPAIDLAGINVMGFWSWQPFLKILIFGLLFIVVSSHEFTEESLLKVLRVMVWCGFITAIYEITQFFFCDQFFNRVADGDWGRIAGFIGNPTLTAPFCAMFIPIALFLKKYFMALVMVIGAILPSSQMTWIALPLGLIVYFALMGPKWFVSFCFLGVLLVSAYFFMLLTGLWHKVPLLNDLFQDHERFIQWNQIIKDWSGPLAKDQGINNNYFLTGRGLGSFRFVYHIQHINIGSPNRFHQAHNDYLEFAYSAGFIGIGLLFGAIFHMIKKNVSMFKVFSFGEKGYSRALLSSLAIISINAIGTFVFQIGTFAFFSVVIAGMLHNESKINDKECIA